VRTNENKSADAPPLTRSVAQFAASTRYEDIPSDVIALSRKAVLDCLGLAFAGSVAEGTILLRRHIASLGCVGGSSTIFGSDMRTHAALCRPGKRHGHAFRRLRRHAQSKPHTSLCIGGGSIVRPRQNAGNYSGPDVLAAFNVGVEVSCKISIATDGAHYGRGFHSSGTIGVFGATAAICNLQRRSTDVALTALGIAGSGAAGVRENFGTMAKPLHAAAGRKAAVLASELAALGYTSAPTVLEGPRGFFAAYAGTCDDSVLLETLGKPWTFATDASIAIKPFPSGRLTHPAMCELERIMHEHSIVAAQVDRIGVKTNKLLPGNLTYHQPATGLQGKFSMEFCLASILVLGKAGLAEFTDEVVNRPDIQAAIGKIDYTCYSDEEAAANRYPLLRDVS
jgi:2-methylcitrate dehydratase PrpD